MQQQQQPSITTPRTPQSSQHQTPHQPSERELPMLAGIGAFVTWCEDLLAVLSGPILTAGLAIALIDLLSDGQLFTRVPMLLWVWAGSMALGLDAQFIGSSAKLARAMRQRRPWVATGYILLCLALGYVAFLATYVFAVQEANGISTTEALSRLGMDSTTWIFQRSVLAVILVFLSGLLRYVPPAKDDALAALSEEEHLQREIRLAPLRAQLRAQQARGARGMVAAALGREEPQPQPMKPRIVTASSTLPPETPPVEHHADTYKAMHDWEEDDLGDILDEVEDESDLFSTLVIPAIEEHDSGVSRPLAGADTIGTKQRMRARKNSGPAKSNLERSKGVREYNRKLKSDAKAKRRAAIRDAVYSILDAWHANGRTEQISDKELARRVAALVNFEVNPSGNTVARWRGPWQSSRAHKAALLNEIPDASDDEVEPMEPQELRELVATEAW